MTVTILPSLTTEMITGQSIRAAALHTQGAAGLDALS